MISFIWNVQNRKIHRDQKYISGCQGLGGWNGEWLLMGTEFSFGGNEHFQKVDSGNVCTILWV